MIYTNSTAIPRDELTDVIMEAAGEDEMFLGLSIFPEAPIQQTTGHVPKIAVGSGDLMRATRKRRTPGTHFDRWQSTISDYSITLYQVGEEELIPDEVEKTYEDYFDLESIYTNQAGQRLRRGLELDHESALFDSSALTATNSTVAYTQANILTMDPVTDIINCIRRIKALGEKPNTIAIPGTVYDRVRVCKTMRDFIAGSINPGAIVTPDTIQAAFASMGITQVLILDSYVNNSDAGKADVIDAIWPVTYIFVGSVKSGALRGGGIGRTFYWEKDGPLFNVTSYRDESRMSNVIRAKKTAYPFVTNARAGQLITTQYS